VQALGRAGNGRGLGRRRGGGIGGEARPGQAQDDEDRPRRPHILNLMRAAAPRHPQEALVGGGRTAPITQPMAAESAHITQFTTSPPMRPAKAVPKGRGSVALSARGFTKYVSRCSAYESTVTPRITIWPISPMVAPRPMTLVTL